MWTGVWCLCNKATNALECIPKGCTQTFELGTKADSWKVGGSRRIHQPRRRLDRYMYSVLKFWATKATEILWLGGYTKLIAARTQRRELCLQYPVARR